MKIKTLLIVSAIGIALATPESLQAQANPKPVRPDVGDVKNDAKEGGKERPKLDVAKIKERLKAAFEKRKKNRGDAKKQGHKVKGKGGKGGGAFGKLVRDDEKIKELRESFKVAAKEQHDAEPAQQYDVGVFAEHKERPGHGRIFDLITGDQFALRFG